ncbi:MAG: hypothetical protein ACU841_07060 [Gammaproteobacteria bacterium]
MTKKIVGQGNDLAVFLVVLATSFGLSYGMLSDGHDWGGDFSAYIMQARSIVEHNPRQWIEENRFTIEHSSRAMGPISYPWGFPLLLAPVYEAYGLDLTALKLVGIAAYLLFLSCLYRGLDIVHSRCGLFLLLSLFAFNPAMLRFGDQIMSDGPFLFFSTLSILVIWRTVSRRQVIVAPVIDQFMLGAIIALSISVRTNGLLLLPTLAVAQLVSLWNRRAGKTTIGQNPFSPSAGSKTRVSGGAILFYLAPYLGWMLLTRIEASILPEGGGSYVDHIRSFSVQETIDSLRYNLALPEAFFGSRYLWFASVPFAFMGVMKRWRDSHCILAYCLLTFALYVFWPFRQGLRFLFPLLPFYGSFVISGLEQVSTATFVCIARNLPMAFAAAAPLFFLYSSTQVVLDHRSHGRPIPDGPFTQEAKAMFGFLERNTTATDVIVFRKPRVLRLMIGRPSIRALNTRDLFLGNFLVIDSRNPDKQLSASVVTDLVNSGKATPAYRNRQFSIYEINHGS